MVRAETPPAHSPAKYGIADQDMGEAIIAITQDILAGYNDEAVLDIQQERLVRTIRDVVHRELQQRLPDQVATIKTRSFIRALTTYITAEVRSRQGWAFEMQLVRTYGPLDPDIDEKIAEQTITDDGVAVISTAPLVHDKRAQSA